MDVVRWWNIVKQERYLKSVRAAIEHEECRLKEAVRTQDEQDQLIAEHEQQIALKDQKLKKTMFKVVQLQHDIREGEPIDSRAKDPDYNPKGKAKKKSGLSAGTDSEHEVARILDRREIYDEDACKTICEVLVQWSTPHDDDAIKEDSWVDKSTLSGITKQLNAYEASLPIPHALEVPLSLQDVDSQALLLRQMQITPDIPPEAETSSTPAELSGALEIQEESLVGFEGASAKELTASQLDLLQGIDPEFAELMKSRNSVLRGFVISLFRTPDPKKARVSAFTIS